MTDFEKLFNENRKFIFKYLMKMTRDITLSEELTQETFFRAYMNYASLKNKEKASVWLCQIAKNCYYSYEKKSRKAERVDEDAIRDVPDPAPSVAEEMAKRDEIERIERVLHGIREPYKEVFMWRVYAELSFKQIAEMFGKTENWACVTYHRARKMIKEGLEGEDHEN